MLRYSALLLISCFPAIVLAQSDTLETKIDTARVYQIPSVTVTSTRARKNVSPVPFSDISGEELANTHTYRDVPALLSNLPSTLFVSQNGNAVGYSDLSIRGFDQRRISVMINGIPQNDPEDHNVYWINFPDIAANLESIQVQRGAGLAIYGAAAIGGSVNLTTTNFANRRSIKVSAGVGLQEFGAGGESTLQKTVDKLSLEVSSGLVDNYAFYGRVSRITSDGYRDVSYANLNSFFLSAVRYDKDLTTQINVFGGPLEDGLAYAGLPKSFIKDTELRRKNFSSWEATENGITGTPRRANERENFSQPHFEMLNDWFLSENLTLKSSLFYYTGDGFFDYLDPFVNAELLRITPENGFPDDLQIRNTIIRSDVSNRHGGWLPRLEWRRENGTLTLGAEMRVHRSNHWGKVLFADGLPENYDYDYKFYEYNGERDIFSVFAREEHKIGSNTLLTAEAQLVYHSYRISNEKSGNSFTRYLTLDSTVVGNGEDLFNVRYVFLNPRIGALTRVTDNISVYGSVAYTSREPRMKNLYDATFGYYGNQPLFESVQSESGPTRYNFDEPLVKPEKLLNIELGAYSQMEDVRLGVNGYWMEFFDELVSNGQLDRFGAPIDGNAPRTRHMGLELEGAAKLFGNLDDGELWLSLNGTISSNTIIEYDYFVDSVAISLEDNPIGGFPEFLANARLTYMYDGFFATILARHVGEFYTDNFKNDANRNDAYTVLNADMSYRFAKILGFNSIKLGAQVNNLLNELYSSGGQGNQFFPAAERNIYFHVELEL